MSAPALTENGTFEQSTTVRLQSSRKPVVPATGCNHLQLLSADVEWEAAVGTTWEAGRVGRKTIPSAL